MKIVRDVAEFHKACKIPILNKPGIPPEDRQKLRIKLIVEEIIEELLPAMGAYGTSYHWDLEQEPDLVEIADGIIDGIVVLTGAALEYGIPLEKVWDEIHQTNMAKTTGPVREDGKILKPEGWLPPNVEGILDDNKS